MAIGIVLLKRVDMGISPITAVPDALANITPLSLGNWTIIVHSLCAVVQIVLQKRISLKSILCVAVGFAFGYLVDLFLMLWNPGLVLWQKIICMILGIVIQGFGVALISGCDMILPAPDELNNLISKLYDKKLSNVKKIADLIYVVLALLINLLTYLFARDNFHLSIGISSVLSIFFTGFFVGLSFKVFPKLKMSSLFKIK